MAKLTITIDDEMLKRARMRQSRVTQALLEVAAHARGAPPAGGPARRRRRFSRDERHER